MKAGGAVILLISLVLGGCNDWRMWETPAVKPHEEPLLAMPAGTVPFGGGEALYRHMAEKDLTSPLVKNRPEDIAAGETAYASYCIHCHGRSHDGNATVGQSFHPLPTDLRGPLVQQVPDGALFKVISYGKPGGRQPALATTIPVEDRWRIIAYLRSLGPR